MKTVKCYCRDGLRQLSEWVYGMIARINRIIAALTAGALLLAACSSPAPAAPELTEVRMTAVNSMTELTNAPLDMDVREFHDQSLFGPHYTLGISWVATGRELDGRDAETFGVQPVRAPEGKQLVVVAVSPKATHAPFQPVEPIQVEVLVDRVGTALSGLPLAEAPASRPIADRTKLVLLSAPPNASLKLRITDDGQAQELDLRAGTSSGHAYQQWESEFHWTGTSPVVFPPPLNSVPAELEVGNPLVASPQHNGDHAYLTNYTSSTWATPGQLFLTMPVPRLFCFLGIRDHVTFDDATAFSFTPSGGTSIPAEPTARDIPLIDAAITTTAPTSFTVDVPDNVTRGTVTFDLSKSRLLSDGSKDTAWTRSPHAYTVNLTFTR